MKRKEGIIDTQRRGLLFLMKKNKIDVFQGLGSFEDQHSVLVQGEKSKEIIKAEHILIATGSKVRELPFAPSDGKTILTSDNIIFCEEPPKSLAIIGGGVIGVEFASLFSAFGTEVTIIEMGPQIIPTEDPECAKELARQLKKNKVKIETNTKLTSLKVQKAGTCVVKTEAKEDRVFDKVLVSIGRQPVTANLNLNKIGIKTEHDFIPVDAHYRTSIPKVFAIGDVIKTPALAHTASAEAIHAVEVIAGHQPPVIDYQANPSAIYSCPEVASIGQSEAELKTKGIAYKSTKFPFAPLAKAKIEDVTEGFIKIFSDSKYGEILGVHIVGAKATELIGEFVLGKILETTVSELAHAIHPHPTISETVMETAHAAVGGAIHM